MLILRQGNTGEIIRGQTDGDVLTWNAAADGWVPAAGGAGLEPGAFVGQALYWDGALWGPVPPDGTRLAIDGLTSVLPSTTGLLLSETNAQLTADTSQLSDTLAQTQLVVTSNSFQGVWSDGTDFTLLVGDGDGLSVSTNGRVRATSLGVDMLLDSAFSVSLGEGADTLSLDTVVGFNVLVEPGKRITLNNANVCRYFIDPGTHIFTVPNAAVDAEVTNLTLSSVGDAPSIGFLGTGAILKRSIVGATAQEQIDSIVAALVAFGLCSDDR